MSEVLDHVAIRVSDLGRSRAFYTAALEPLGFRLLYETHDEREGGRGVAFGRLGADDFAIHEPIPSLGRNTITRGVHIAFRADGVQAVAAFHAAAARQRRPQHRRARTAHRVQRRVLRRVRARPGRQQHRGGLARAGPIEPT